MEEQLQQQPQQQVGNVTVVAVAKTATTANATAGGETAPAAATTAGGKRVQAAVVAMPGGIKPVDHRGMTASVAMPSITAEEMRTAPVVTVVVRGK